MTPRDHVARAQVLAEAATDPRDVAAYKAVAAAWERMSGPATSWSAEPAQRQLAQLQREVAASIEQAATHQQPILQSWPPTEGDTQRQIGRTHRVPIATITF